MTAEVVNDAVERFVGDGLVLVTAAGQYDDIVSLAREAAQKPADKCALADA